MYLLTYLPVDNKIMKPAHVWQNAILWGHSVACQQVFMWSVSENCKYSNLNHFSLNCPLLPSCLWSWWIWNAKCIHKYFCRRYYLFCKKYL